MKAKHICIAALSLAVISCAEEGSLRETTAATSSDKTELSLPPESGSDPVDIISNRSWTLSCSDDWLTVDKCESVNLSGRTLTTRIVVSAEANPVREHRSASLIITSEAGTTTIPVIQKRARPTVSYSFSDKTRYLDPQYFSSLGGKRWEMLSATHRGPQK